MTKKENKKIRIGLLTHNYPAKSSESKDAGKFVYAFAHELAKKADVFVFCPDYGGKKEKDKKIPVTWFKWGSSGEKFGNWKLFSPPSLIKFINLSKVGCREVIKFINKNNIDYVLSFWNFPSGMFAWYTKKKIGVSYSTWALGSDIYIYPKLPIVKQITQNVLKNADHVYGNSLDICKAIKKLSGVRGEFLPTSNLIVLSNYKKPNLDKKKFNFLCLARLEKVKGPDVLVEASRLLAQKRKDFTVSFIGGGTMYEDLKEKVGNYQLEKNINILGYVEDQGIVNGYLKDVDCLVIPSRSESFPLVVTEVLQTGQPMIGSDVGDMPDFIGGNKLGFIFPKGNPEFLARAMGKMIKEGRNIKKNKKSLMNKLSDEFRLGVIVDKFLSSILA